MQSVLAGFIRKISDPLSVRRPSRIAVGHAGGIGDVANVALFGGNRKNFAVRFENGADARWRDGGVIDLLGDLFKVWTDLDEIRGNVNFHELIVMAREIEKMQRAKLLVDDGARSQVGRFDRQSGILGKLRLRLRLCVISKE